MLRIHAEDQAQSVQAGFRLGLGLDDSRVAQSAELQPYYERGVELGAASQEAVAVCRGLALDCNDLFEAVKQSIHQQLMQQIGVDTDDIEALADVIAAESSKAGVEFQVGTLVDVLGADQAPLTLANVAWDKALADYQNGKPAFAEVLAHVEHLMDGDWELLEGGAESFREWLDTTLHYDAMDSGDENLLEQPVLARILHVALEARRALSEAFTPSHSPSL